MSTPNEPRICIVGAGSLSTLRIYPNIAPAGARLVGVCDIDAAKAERNARLYGGRAYADMEQMLAEQKPDGVMVCIGPKAHAALAIRILRAGYPVYTEKPPASSAAEALEVARVAKETKLLCTTAFKKRYTHAANRAKKWLEQFAPEDWLSLSIDYCSAAYPDDLPAEAGFLMDFTVHIMDLSSYLFGDVESVFAYARDKSAYAVSLRFKNGAVGVLNLTDGRSFAIPTEETEITVKGGNFMTIHNSSVWKITEKEKPCEWREPPTFVSRGDSGNDTGHLLEIVDFVQALREGRTTSRSQIYEGYKTMVLYEAIRDSAASGQERRVEYQTV